MKIDEIVRMDSEELQKEIDKREQHIKKLKDENKLLRKLQQASKHSGILESGKNERDQIVENHQMHK